jgi:hypothetical protein
MSQSTQWLVSQSRSRNDAVKELNLDRINRIYRMEKRMLHQKQSLTARGILFVPEFILFIL